MVVQVKHTGKESETIADNIINDEKTKVKLLVGKKKLDTYIIFTNYEVSSDQEEAYIKNFTSIEVGAKNVIVVGKEKLSQWLHDSLDLQLKVIRYYPRAMHITDLVDCPKAVQSIQLLKQYGEEEQYGNTITILNTAKEIVRQNGFVFITGSPKCGKTIIARQLVVHLSKTYSFIEITFTHQFDDNWIPDKKQVFFMDNIDTDDVKKWYKLEDKLKIALKVGSKFVFSGKLEVLNEKWSRFYDFKVNMPELPPSTADNKTPTTAIQA